MIEFKVDEIELKKIEARLDNMGDRASDVLKKAINDTAKQARTRITKQAQTVYAARRGRFNKNMKIENAKKGSLVAIISSKGKATELMDYKTSPVRPPNANNRPNVTKAKVIKKNSMKDLEKGGIKAFVVRFKSGHVSVVQRVPGKKMKSNPKKEFLRKLLSPSIPQLVGNEEKVYNTVQPHIYSDLQENINKHIDKVLGG